jgi:hypothetical protein
MSGSVTMSYMNESMGERGELNVLLIPVVLLAVLFIGAASFAFWAYSGRQDYKNNSDAKVAVAVTADTQSVQAADAKQYAEASKSPLRLYSGPDAYGSVKVQYPKTWSAYVDTTNTTTPLDAYFHDDFVPSTASQETYNLRVQVNSQPYSTVLQQYSALITEGKVTASAYALPKVPSVVGTQMSGSINQNNPLETTGDLVLLPLRNMTLEIWTESNGYLSDFNTYILPNISFSP